MKSFSMAEILQLSSAERIRLAQDIWDSVAAVPQAVVLSESQKSELEKRLAHVEQNPTAEISWNDLKNHLLKKK